MPIELVGTPVSGDVADGTGFTTSTFTIPADAEAVAIAMSGDFFGSANPINVLSAANFDGTGLDLSLFGQHRGTTYPNSWCGIWGMTDTDVNWPGIGPGRQINIAFADGREINLFVRYWVFFLKGLNKDAPTIATVQNDDDNNTNVNITWDTNDTGPENLTILAAYHFSDVPPNIDGAPAGSNQTVLFNSGDRSTTELIVVRGQDGDSSIRTENHDYPIGVAVTFALAAVVVDDRYWIANTPGNWSDTANWSTTSGGAGGSPVPAPGNIVTFDANGVGAVTMDGADLLTGITTNVTNNITWNLNSSANRQQANANIDIANNSTLTLAGSFGFWRFNNSTITINTGSTLTGASLRNADNADLTVAGDGNCASILQIDAGIVYTISGNLNQTGLLRIDSGTFLAIASPTLSDVQFDSVGSTFSLNNNNGGTVAITGDFNRTDSASFNYIAGNGTTLVLSSDEDQFVNFANEAIDAISYEKFSGTVTFTAGFQTDAFTWQPGAGGTANLNQQDITVVGDFVAAAGASFTEPV